MQNKPILFTFAIVHFCVAQDVGDICWLANKQKGRCVLLRTCEPALAVIKQSMHPQICGFKGKEPIVCCEEDFQNSDKVKQPSLHTATPTITTTTTDSPYIPGLKSRQNCELFSPLKFGSTFVINGDESLAKEFPHMAALGFGSPNNVQWSCGGSLISEYYVITAAHCLNSKELGEVKWVRLGDLNLRKDDDDAQPQDFEVTANIPHPLYRPPLQYNDIALIRLDRKVDFNEYINPICLQTTYQLPQGASKPIATGWGYTQFGGKTSDVLMKVTLNYYDAKSCNQTYGNVSKRRLPEGINDESHLCAGGIDEQKDTCQGDSGGPLQIFDDRYLLIGITSFGKACGILNTPGVYTRVSNYIPWIESIVWPK